MSSVDGKVAIVTGAGAGLGRAEALALARAGANVVVNDVTDAAHAVVAEIEEIGTKAVAVVGDVSDSEVSAQMMAAATERLGGLHVVVNNAGLLRDRMLFKMSDQEWDDVLRVHLRGHFLLSRNATAHWRQEYKDTGATSGSIINTASEAFLLGSAGQPNYAAAKGGIAALTVSTARAMSRMGVRANAICPRARTAMTAETFGDAPGEGVDPMSVEHVAPLVTYLAGPSAQAISGQVFVVHSGVVALLAPPTIERKFAASGELWTQEDLESGLGAYFADRDPEKSFAANDVLAVP
ncbi:3-oxoacyl-ACP reductase [Saccharopolyspora mangrovi]|uniref:3-oxoacyl-ACP reductase n=1 Tax=Saccharopolyspora mangrovi TaxID=3082379 RepID=A0ABU6AGT1_9PSEU|nr:3-oxoacyl-ACP reductase [Saccharopolyspora sp. S2-29]MEB3370636.1 3-oxoacyl-ACP reductase [Saccharopolyspora sp. S2-29]